MYSTAFNLRHAMDAIRLPLIMGFNITSTQYGHGEDECISTVTIYNPHPRTRVTVSLTWGWKIAINGWAAHPCIPPVYITLTMTKGMTLVGYFLNDGCNTDTCTCM
jgi:hypothetical protein